MPASPQRVPLTVAVVDARGRPLRGHRLAAWLSRVAPVRRPSAVTIAVVSDARVRALNRSYRGKNRTTDVLSFPTASPSPFLGDIVIARGVARRQAREAGHGERTEWRVLALHGLLHLLGYDHETDNGRMARVEARLRQKGGLPPGLIERTDR
jgi:probable rRNA maturation factor